MKHLFFTVALIAGSLFSSAQKNPTNLVNLKSSPTIGKEMQAVDKLPDLLELTITNRYFSTKVNAKLDTGHSQTYINFAPRKNGYIVKGNDNGSRGKYNRIEFNSTAAVLKYFKDMGYSIESVNGYGLSSNHNTGLLKILQIASRSRGQRFILSK